VSLFDISERAQQLQSELLDFMKSSVYPAEPVSEEQMRESGDPHFQPRSSRSSRPRLENAGCGICFTLTPAPARV
jgi:hypothetical protein